MATMSSRLQEYVTVLSGTSSVQARLQHAMALRTEDVQPGVRRVQNAVGGRPEPGVQEVQLEGNMGPSVAS